MRCGILGTVVRLGGAAILLATPALAAEAQGGQSLLSIFWNGIEWPAWFILLGSLVVISLIVEHFLTVRAASISPPDQIKHARAQIESRNFRECLDAVKKSQTFFAKVMTAALSHGRHGFDAMHEAAIEKSGELSGTMFRKIEYVNILGNLGPLLGLLGTVWGMIIAFGDLGAGGGAGGAGDLARGISLALVNTLLGLALAIVGIGFFGVCRNRIESLTVTATVQVLDLLEYFRPSAVSSRSAAPERAATERPSAKVGRAETAEA